MRSRLRSLSEALDHRACPTTVGRLLRKQGYGLRSHRKVLHTGKPHAERDRQFRRIAALREEFRESGDPRISVDAKKKELVGNFKNAGQSWRKERRKGQRPRLSAGRRVPRVAIRDLRPGRNEGHVCVTASGDTPELAMDAIADWWRLHGPDYPQAKRLMVEADGGGSNAARSRCFKRGLQDFANETGLEVTVCHYPPGTSKWNPIEHRLFSQITATWSGFVLSTLAVLLGFIRRTTTRTRLESYRHALREDVCKRPTSRQRRIQGHRIARHDICPQWNYTIHPQTMQNTE